MLMKNSNDTIGKRTRALLVCSTTNCATTAQLTFEYLVKILYNLRPSDTRQPWIKFKPKLSPLKIYAPENKSHV
jgi:hypothetical protein